VKEQTLDDELEALQLLVGHALELLIWERWDDALQSLKNGLALIREASGEGSQSTSVGVLLPGRENGSIPHHDRIASFVAAPTWRVLLCG
jgi:hypothetical protein